MVAIHLTSSTFFGGPERQMLGLAAALRPAIRTVFLSFHEGGRCDSFVDAARQRGFEASMLTHDTPRFGTAIRELSGRLRRVGAGVLCCHGYKADLLGRPAARRAGVPAVAVSRGWIGVGARVRLYEALDRLALPLMDRVVCVSEAQAVKVRRAGVAPTRVVVIRNAIRVDRFGAPDPAVRRRLLDLFPDDPDRLVGAAGRLSPEKGFAVLVRAARRVVGRDPSCGFVLLGDGPSRPALARQVEAEGLAGRFVLAGFRDDLDRVLPCLDLVVLPSFTEGLPNIVLEACAAGVPVVATAVGGTPEVLDDRAGGFLVPPGDADALADRIADALADEDRRQAMGRQARRRVEERFTFEEQARRYGALFDDLAGPRTPTEVRPCVVPSASAS